MQAACAAGSMQSCTYPLPAASPQPYSANILPFLFSHPDLLCVATKIVLTSRASLLQCKIKSKKNNKKNPFDFS